ncbi:MAG: helix-turn-helix domain-containing protein [Caldilineaceae bacterium]
MPVSHSPPPTATTFGDLLRQLRRRAGLTQGELAALVGFSVAQISRLEQNERLPDLSVLAEKFAPALALQEEPRLAQRLLELAAVARGERPPTAIQVTRTVQTSIHEEVLEGDSHLPAPPTTLIGREQEVATIGKRLLDVPGRLLTLVGPPGVGKTRLALEVAAKVQDLFAQGVHFIPLAAATAPEQVAAALVNNLQLEASQKPARERLIEFLRRKALLLIIDNFEQVMDAATLLADLLAECPQVYMLVTSREPLHLRAEQRFKVQPLSPAAAVALFIERAQTIDPDFVYTHENTAAITELCLRLDRLPLAIELVAARVDLLSPQKLLAHWQAHQLDLFTDSAPRDADTRHQTLRTAIGWSYHLLTAEAQWLLACLGVFQGGCTAEAALAVGGAPLAALKLLTNQSLLKAETQPDGEVRFAMLETIHAFAMEQLQQQPEAAPIQQRHALYFLQVAEQTAEQMQSKAKKVWLDRLEQDHDNLRAALRWLVAQDAEAAQRLSGALREFWVARGYFHEGRAWLKQALAQGQAPTYGRALALLAAGHLAHVQDEYPEARRLLTESAALFRQLGDPRGAAEALRTGAWVEYGLQAYSRAGEMFEESLALFRQCNQQERVAATLLAAAQLRTMQGEAGDFSIVRRYLAESLSIYRQLEQADGIAFGLNGQGLLEVMSGHYAKAIECYTEALHIFRALDDKRNIPLTLDVLGEAEWLHGDLTAARLHWQESYDLYQTLKIPWGKMMLAHHLGQVERCEGKHAAAIQRYRESLALAWELKDNPVIARCLVGLGGVALTQGAVEQAGQLFAAAQTLFDQLPPFLPPGDQAEYRNMVATVRSALGEEGVEKVAAQEAMRTTAQVVAYGLGTF